MAQEVYSNENGTVLFGASGQITKVPYKFGKAYKNDPNVNTYININNLNLGLGFSVILIAFLDDSQRIQPLYQLVCDSLNKASNVEFRDNVEIFFNFIDSKDDATRVIYQHDQEELIPKVIHFSGNGYIYDGEKYVLGPTPLTDISYNSLKIAASRLFTTDDITPLEYPTGNSYYHRLYVINRQLSLYELKYLYNNGIYSELQNSNDLMIDVNMQKSEILDFSDLQDGSDMRVGVRDFSGNKHHGEIMNLPAGTLQEQLDYANTNLFVPILD